LFEGLNYLPPLLDIYKNNVVQAFGSKSIGHMLADRSTVQNEDGIYRDEGMVPWWFFFL
jgi:hypothetical protein